MDVMSLLLIVGFLGFLPALFHLADEYRLKTSNELFFALIWPITLFDIIFNLGMIKNISERDYLEYRKKAEANGVIFIDSVAEYHENFNNPEAFKKNKKDRQLSNIAEQELLDD